MPAAVLEHVNVTVSDAAKVAEVFCKLFDWQVRWSGPAIDDGVSYHVGGEGSYLALYSKGGRDAPANSYTTPGGLNHLGVVVEDLDLVEACVKEMGFETHSHADYEPGRRFYFDGPDDIEIEVVSYQGG